MRLKVLFILAVVGFASTTACTDSPTAPTADPQGATARPATLLHTGELTQSASVQATGRAEYRCTFQIIDPATGHYRTREAHLRFPPPELHLLGAVREYRYEAYAGTQKVIAAQCLIPATDRAKERMDRRFKVVREHQRPGDAVATMSDDCCETVVVTACLYGGGSYYDDACNSAPEEDYAQCYYFGECGGSGEWDWTNGGGGGSEGGGEGDPPPVLTPYQQGPLLFAACVLAFTGSIYTINQVSNLFTEWWYAQRDYDSVKRIMEAIYANIANTSQATVEVYELRLDLARQRRDAAVSAVMGATDMTAFALAGAAVACGASMFMPTV